MTATAGGPGLQGAGTAASASAAGRSGALERSKAPKLRMMLGLARAEAWLLARSVLVLAGLPLGGLIIWLTFRPFGPLWWNASWEIGSGQIILGMGVLMAAHLAAGRARRDSMADLYASFPATAGTRTLAHLTGLAGALPASLLLIGGTAVVVEVLGPIGTPNAVTLAAGVLLVIASGAIGIAIATRFPHPLAGVLGALALFVPFSQSNRYNDATSWVFPWATRNDLEYVPGPLAGYPPAVAHAAELAGIAVLAAAVALAVTVNKARARRLLATTGVLAVAVTLLAGALQLQPIPTADVNRLVNEIADPASVQHCTTTSHVRYCLYQGFGHDLATLEAPVDGVLAHVPALPGQPLTVRQVASMQFSDSDIMYGHSQRQVAEWNAQLARTPGNAASASAVYLMLGLWPAGGAPLADAHFELALAAADWAVHLAPTVSRASVNRFVPCVPLDQPREAIAIWLAIEATHLPASELQSGLGNTHGYAPTAEVSNINVPAWAYPGFSAGGYLLPSEVAPITTAAGYLLAKAMTSLPEQQVSRVLRDGWARWMSWHTTDAQLAAALGIPMPSVPAPPPASHAQPPGSTGPNSQNNQPQPQNPVCTT
jgi:hypothetical protein